MTRDPVESDENRYQRDQMQREREWEAKLADAAEYERLCLSDPASLAAAILEEGDEALASALILLRTNPGHGTIVCVNTAVSDCVKRHVDKLTQGKYERGAYEEDVPAILQEQAE